MKYDKDWYDSLIKPDFQPPSWVFAPVWTILYSMMMIALLLVVFSPTNEVKFFAYLAFFFQLYVNFMWPVAFFEEHNLRKAFLLSFLLLILVFVTMIIFYMVSKIAGALFIPYFLWCLFATVLSFEILERNEW